MTEKSHCFPKKEMFCVGGFTFEDIEKVQIYFGRHESSGNHWLIIASLSTSFDGRKEVVLIEQGTDKDGKKKIGFGRLVIP